MTIEEILESIKKTDLLESIESIKKEVKRIEDEADELYKAGLDSVLKDWEDTMEADVKKRLGVKGDLPGEVKKEIKERLRKHLKALIGEWGIRAPETRGEK